MGLLWQLFHCDAAPDDRAALQESVFATRRALKRAYGGFNSAVDPELVESYVYEINALEHRHSYLQQKLRELEKREETAAAN